MTDHPLTDELAVDIVQDATWSSDIVGEVVFIYEDMRAAADWQLEQVIKFIAKEDTEYADYIKKAMRPQQQEEN